MAERQPSPPGRRRYRASRVAISGPAGSFSHAAARALVPGAHTVVSCRDFDAALAAVVDDRADRAVLPRENTLVGAIVPALDAVLDRSLRIVAETILPIEHCLIGAPGAHTAQVATVHSHPAALAQCRARIARQGWATTTAPDTATAVQEVVARGDVSVAAIGSREAARLYGGTLLVHHLADRPHNFTRFVLVGGATATWPHRANALTAEVCLPHEAGALASILDVFRERRLSILSLDTRPDRSHPWRLRFIVDLMADAPVDWDDVSRRVGERASRVRVLGRYMAAPARTFHTGSARRRRTGSALVTQGQHHLR